MRASSPVRLAWLLFVVVAAVAAAWAMGRTTDVPTPAVAAAGFAGPSGPVTMPAALPSLTGARGAAAAAAAPGSKTLKPIATPKRRFRPHEVLVVFAPDASAEQRAELRRRVGATAHESLGGDAEKLTLAPGRSTKRASAQLSGADGVLAADRNAVIHAAVAPNDALYSSQWALSSPFDTDLDAEEGWAASTDATTTVPVAVIDTGIDLAHPDLASQLWTNPGETGTAANGQPRQSNNVDDDGNGKVDDWRGWDFVGNDKDPSDDNYHGTHVSGIIAAQRGNGVGVAGVSSQARIMPLKVLAADGSGDEGAMYQAVQYAIAKGAKVVNGSIGSPYGSNVLGQLIQSATGITFVFAAGNESVSLDSANSFPCETPGANVICVGATDPDGQRASYSNVSATQVDLVAPGTDIVSTVPTAVVASGYAKLSGTSMATPAVAGAAAVLASKFPSLSPAQIRTRLMAGTDPLITPGTATSGRLNLAGAIAGSRVAPASTGAVAVSAGRLTYTAASGAANRVTLAANGASYTLEDVGVSAITAGASCTAVTAQKVTCSAVSAVTINSGDLGDTVDAVVPAPVTIDAGSGPAVVNTGSGNDTITTGESADNVQSGDGDDTVSLGDGDDVLHDDGGNNTVHGGPGQDNLDVLYGTDQVYGDDGNDTLYSGGLNDTIDGGAGNDWIWVRPGVGAHLIGGADHDMVSYGDYDDDVQVVLGGVNLSGAEGEHQTIDGDVEDGMGGRGNDVVWGNAGPNRLIGGIGDDAVYGNGGDDVIDQWLDAYGQTDIQPQLGSDVISGGPGNDTVAYESALGDQIFGRGAGYPVTVTLDDVANDGTPGTGEADNVMSTTENIIGTNGDDTLIGSSAANTLIGGGGDDVLRGQGGTDTYVGDRTGTCSGGCVAGSRDVVSYSTATGPVTASLDGVANDGIAGENENIPASVEKLVGGSSADTLTAGTSGATLEGGPGADTLRGGPANDTLIANDGVVDAVLECKGGSGDYVLRDSNETANTDCESSATSDTPDTTITAGPTSGTTVTRAPQFTFTSTKPGGRAECAVGEDLDAPYFPCSSPWQVPAEANGAVRVYKIRAISATGVADPSPATVSLWYDTAAPRVSVTGGPAYGATVYTPTVSIPFTSTGETVTYECRFDLGDWSACSSPFVTPTLAPGEHEVWLQTKDARGNRGPVVPLQFNRAPQVLTVPAGVATASSVPLTTDAALGASLDWIHWKGAAATDLDRKNADQRISTWSLAGPTGPTAYDHGGATFTWTDAAGAPASASSDLGVVRGLTNGVGFALSVPAVSSETRKLRVYVGVRGATTVGTLKVGFGAQTPVTQTVAGNSTTSIVNRTFTIDYRPLAGTDTLNVQFVQTAGGSAQGSSVFLYAAAVY